MILLKNELISAIIVTCIITFLVWAQVPRTFDSNGKPNDSRTIFKTAVISFLVCYVLFYFMKDTEREDVLINIKTGEPTF